MIKIYTCLGRELSKGLSILGWPLGTLWEIILSVLVDAGNSQAPFPGNETPGWVRVEKACLACVHSEHWHACWVLAGIVSMHTLWALACMHYFLLLTLDMMWLGALGSCCLDSPVSWDCEPTPFLSLAFFWVFYHSNRKWKQGTIPAGTGAIRLSRDTGLCKSPAYRPLSICHTDQLDSCSVSTGLEPKATLSLT